MSPTPAKRGAADTADGVKGASVRKRRRTSSEENRVTSLGPMLDFWFSPTNLSHDRFLTNAMLRADGWIPVALFVSFKKVVAIQATEDDVLTALRRVRRPQLEFAIGANGIRNVRIAGGLLELKRLVDGAREDEDERTIYIETLPVDATRKEVTDAFKGFGEVAYTSVPRFPDGNCKGFGFVEFSRVEKAASALKAIREGSCKTPRFGTFRALPRAEWRRRKEKYKDEKRAAQVAAAKARAGGDSLSNAHGPFANEEVQNALQGHAQYRRQANTKKIRHQVEPNEAEQLNTRNAAEVASTKDLALPERNPRVGSNYSPDTALEKRDHREEASRVNQNIQTESETQPNTTLEQGLIVSITGLEKVEKKITRRALFESLKEYGPVAYVDYSPRAPDVCKARFGEAASAQTAVAALAPSGGGTMLGGVVRASVLTGEVEIAYWNSIQARREVRKNRQADKAAKKAAQKAARRVRPRAQSKRAEKST